MANDDDFSGIHVFWSLWGECVSSSSSLSKVTDFVGQTNPPTRDRLELFRKVESIEKAVSVYDLFQRDEIIDDIPINSLKYLLLGFMKAQCLESVTDMKVRHGALLTAKFNYSLFVHEACWYGRERKKFLMAQAEFDSFNALDYENLDKSSIPAEDRRAMVIARRQNIKMLEDNLRANVSEAYKGEDTPEVFEFWVDVIYSAVLESITCVDLINQELPLIARFGHQEGEGKTGGKNGDVSREARLDGTGKILSKPFIMKISNSAELRKLYASQVLQPGHILPTISIAEAGLYDMKVEVEGLQRAQKQTVKEYNDGASSFSGEEEEEAKESHSDDEGKEIKARRWDDWKDEHPRGSGNTLVNRG